MNIHFIAIGGSAMHNLALALAEKGHRITGSDDAIFEPSLSRLKKAGILPEAFGWFPEKITPAIDAVILGMHARGDNPELLQAQSLGIPIYSYPEFLFRESRDKKRIVVAGSHGKTTITSMVLHAARTTGVKTDFMVGALLEGFERMVELSRGNPYIVIEGDEYLSSPLDLRSKFLHYKPHIALISGIAWDHMNVFKTYPDYCETFAEFIRSIEPDGKLIYNVEDPEVVRIVEQTLQNSERKDIERIPYSTFPYNLKNGQVFLDTSEGEIPLKVFGRHNLSNLSGAEKICLQMGISESDFYHAAATFSGASRRLEKMAEKDGCVLYRDFAHAPSKVRATVDAVRELYPDKKLIAALELHTFSSLSADFLPQYRGSLDKADRAMVFYSTEAMRLKRMPELDPEWVKAQFGSHPELSIFTGIEPLKKQIKAEVRDNSVFLMMSSGNWDKTDWKEELGLASLG